MNIISEEEHKRFIIRIVRIVVISTALIAVGAWMMAVGAS